jgi:hypothetical protein
VEIESGADPRSVLPTINKLVIPEIALHVVAVLVLGCTLNWVELVVNSPLVYYHLKLYVPCRSPIRANIINQSVSQSVNQLHMASQCTNNAA